MKRSSCQEREKKRKRKATTPTDSSDHGCQRNSPGPRHATSNFTSGGSRAKTKGKATEGKKTGHPSLDGDEKNRPHQHAAEMEVAPIPHLTHWNPRTTTATHLPLQFSPLSREKKNTTNEPVTNKTTKPRHSRQQGNDPAARSQKKKKQKSEKSTDSSDHDNQRNRPGPRR
jgi:hypothetical protein